MALQPVAQDLGPYWVDDAPTRPVLVEFTDEYHQLVDVPADAEYAGTIISPTNVVTPIEITPDAESNSVSVAWPADFVLDVPGVWAFVLKESGVRLTVLAFVVQANDGWLDLDRARAIWADAPEDDASLYDALESAKVQCIDYAPAIPLGAPVPINYRQAQIKQAKAIWADLQGDAAGNAGPDGFAVPIYSMGHEVKKLLRPQRAKPVIR